MVSTVLTRVAPTHQLGVRILVGLPQGNTMKPENDFPDMEISIVYDYHSESWSATVYYPGFDRDSEIICEGKSRGLALKETIEFLES